LPLDAAVDFSTRPTTLKSTIFGFVYRFEGLNLEPADQYFWAYLTLARMRCKHIS
jgi:hypothetical protein